MAALSQFFYLTLLVLYCLIFELVIQIRYVIMTIRNIFGKGMLSAPEYLKFIEENVPAISYSNRLGSMDCAVCLSDFKEGEAVRNLKCKHTFHKSCLDKWLRGYLTTCPICRTEVLPSEFVADYKRLKYQMENDRIYEGDMFGNLLDRSLRANPNLQTPELISHPQRLRPITDFCEQGNEGL
ncbi:unnamed protein product [Dovyalis caffra]|uniref:RING-type domain-containing protein n=1 Tax=Dovyalis caffra TaxID=77055 RepID=A0AAV1RF14_9ROSI|nr:unnamed protein product [Dovyalis caffra]